MPKIAFVGAGRVVFSKQLLVDIMSYPEFEGSTFSLMDIDPERLGMIKSVAEKVAARSSSRFTFTATENLREALQGADYVICLVQVGGYASTKVDFAIPAKYGLAQTIGDSYGVGGIFRALRTYPVLDEICQTMLEVCPNATLLNYTNPMAMLSLYVLRKYPAIRYVGLCHSVQTTGKQLALYLDIPYAELTTLVAGINHQAWFLRIARAGRDCYPKLRELNDRLAEDWEYIPEHLHSYQGKDTWFRENFKDSAGKGCTGRPWSIRSVRRSSTWNASSRCATSCSRRTALLSVSMHKRDKP